MDFLWKPIIVACLLLPFVLVYKFIQFLVNRRNDKEVLDNTKSNNDWYGICDNCGKKDGLHRMNGKHYCAMCHAKLKAEKCALKMQESEKKDGN